MTAALHAASSSGADGPTLRSLLASDLLAATGRRGLRATCAALVFDPGFSTVAWFRLSQALHRAGWKRCAKLVWRINTACSACHLHLDAHVGPGLFLPHPTGVVVGAEVRLGQGVTLYQNVTIGRGHREAEYPEIANGVVVYPGAVVAGGLRIGAGATVGAGAVLAIDVPAGSVATGNPARVVRQADQAAHAGHPAGAAGSQEVA